jgi:hypothetical protein
VGAVPQGLQARAVVRRAALLVAIGAAAAACKHAAAPPQVSGADVPAADQLLVDVRWLADPARQGRFAGTDAEQAADAWVAERFKSLALEPGGEHGTFLQDVPFARGTTHNVIGILRGSGTDGRWILVGAHVDHLGVTGGTLLYPGADDNASGVAGMLGVAAAWSKAAKPRATIVFVAFGGEEDHLDGSRWLSAHSALPLEKCAAVINLDMIGRSPFLGAHEYEMGRKLMGIEGAGVGVLDSPGSGLLEVARAACKDAGIAMHAAEDFPLFEGQIRDQAQDRSDDSPFAAHHVPTLFFSTSLQDDYHQPTDTVDKIDADVLHRITRAVWLATQKLAS